MFISNAVMFTKRIGSHFRELPRLNATNIVDYFYKYSLLIDSYSTIANMRRTSLPFVSINDDKTLKGQPLFLFPTVKPNAIETELPRALNPIVSERQKSVNEFNDNGVSEYYEFKQKMKSDTVEEKSDEFPVISKNPMTSVQCSVDKALRKNHLKLSEIKLTEKMKGMDVEKIVQSVNLGCKVVNYY